MANDNLGDLAEKTLDALKVLEQEAVDSEKAIFDILQSSIKLWEAQTEKLRAIRKAIKNLGGN